MKKLFLLLNILFFYNANAQFSSDINECQAFNICTEQECFPQFNHECLCQCALGSSHVECFPEFNMVCENLISEFDQHCEENDDIACQQYNADMETCGVQCTDLGNEDTSPDDTFPDTSADTSADTSPDTSADTSPDTSADEPKADDTSPDTSADEPKADDTSPDTSSDEPKADDTSPDTSSDESKADESKTERGSKKCCDRETVMCVSCVEKKSTEDICAEYSNLMGCSTDNMFPPEFDCPFEENSESPCYKSECSDMVQTLNIRDSRPECLRIIKTYCEDKDELLCSNLKKRDYFTEALVPSEQKIIEKANVKLDIKVNSVKEEVEIGIVRLEREEIEAHLDTTRYSNFNSEIIALTPHGQTFEEAVILEIPFNYSLHGSDKQVSVEISAVEISNEEIKKSVRIVRAITPDSITWTELTDAYEVVDKIETVNRHLTHHHSSHITQKILKVPIYSFSVYAVVSAKPDEEQPIEFDKYVKYYNYSSEPKKMNLHENIPFIITVAVSAGCVCSGLLVMAYHKQRHHDTPILRNHLTAVNNNNAAIMHSHTQENPLNKLSS